MPSNSKDIGSTNGNTTQHLQYLPYGETFVDQHGTFDSRYTFSAKELDDETQYSYFGARYYDSDLSVWLSVDPMADKYPSLSPYAYCANNPVMLVDPDGRFPIRITFIYNGQTFVFKSNSRNPQKFKISSEFGTTKFSFKSEYSRRMSMQLLRDNRCQELEDNQTTKENEGDQTLDVRKMNHAVHGEYYLFDLLIAMLEQNPNIELVIIGNHAVRKLSNMYTSGDEIFDNRNSYRSEETEAEFTQLRADYIKNLYFKDSQYVKSISRYYISTNQFPNISLSDFGDEPVGITITFNYARIINARENKSVTQSSNVRFL